jgi:multidrug efflux system outer membrane protein
VLARPDVRAASSRIEANGLRAEAARRAFLPDLTLTGEFTAVAGSLPGLWDTPLTAWSVLGGVVQPLIDGGRLRMRHQIARADLAVALAEYRRALIGAVGELEQQIEDERLQAARSRLLGEAAAAAQASERELADRYAGGQVDLLDALAAQRRQVQVQAQAVEARFQAYSAHLRRCVASGCDPIGGFDEMLRHLILDRIASEVLP